MLELARLLFGRRTGILGGELCDLRTSFCLGFRVDRLQQVLQRFGNQLQGFHLVVAEHDLAPAGATHGTERTVASGLVRQKSSASPRR